MYTIQYRNDTIKTESASIAQWLIKEYTGILPTLDQLRNSTNFIAHPECTWSYEKQFNDDSQRALINHLNSARDIVVQDFMTNQIKIWLAQQGYKTELVDTLDFYIDIRRTNSDEA